MTLRESVVKRTGMYFGDVEAGGANVVVYELIANAIDLFLNKAATTITVAVEGPHIVVSDDGPGFQMFKERRTDAIGIVERYMTVNHNAPTADGHAPHVHILAGGLGLAVLNAASERLVITSSDGVDKWMQTFGKGEILSPPTKTSTGDFPGTTISMTLDPIVFGSHEPDLLELRKVVFELAHLYPGLHIELNEEHFFSKHGLLDYGYLLWRRDCTDRIGTPRMFGYTGRAENIEFHVAALGDEIHETDVHSWVNGVATVKNGTHVKGFQTALCNNNWNPQIALIHVVMHDPRYAGPCKDALRSEQVQATLECELTKAIRSFLADV